MAPLIAEAFDPRKEEWVTFATLKPGDRPGSMSNNLPEGREVILFECAKDDSYSTVRKSRAGVDFNPIEAIRSVVPSAGFDVLATLKDGESFEMDIKTDISAAPKKIRLTHTAEK